MTTSTRAVPMLDRPAVLAQYRSTRARSRTLFDLLVDEAYYTQPIELRHPIVFYEGHFAAFSFNTLVKRALGRPSIDEGVERLFARGIDPEDPHPQLGNAHGAWPDRHVVHAFVAEADRQVLDCLQHADLERPGDALLNRGDAVFTILEHEAMHQETLLYMLQRLPFHQKRAPRGYAPALDGPVPSRDWIDVPAGRATLGADREALVFGWDNESPAFAMDVPTFSVERHDVTNAAFLEFVESGGYAEPRWWEADDWAWIQASETRSPLFWESDGSKWLWRGMFGRFPLPLSWPVYVSHVEASAYTRWRGARLMSEAEFQRAAFGAPDARERQHPWGDDEPAPAHGVFDFASWDPQPAGTHPAGRSAWGVDDLVGNGWEWTATPFGPFPGFRSMPSYPEYSADFFDGGHFVMKGASPATAKELLRPTLRNWFRGRYPYVYATFRCARSAK